MSHFLSGQYNGGNLKIDSGIVRDNLLKNQLIIWYLFSSARIPLPSFYFQRTSSVPCNEHPTEVNSENTGFYAPVIGLP